MIELFVYGTLKRGCANHRWLAGQTFLCAARTAPGYRLFMLQGYPGMVPWPMDRDGVTGEIWQVDAECLADLDRFEGVDENLFRREEVPLFSPTGKSPVQAYIYARAITGRAELGHTWEEGNPKSEE